MGTEESADWRRNRGHHRGRQESPRIRRRPRNPRPSLERDDWWVLRRSRELGRGIFANHKKAVKAGQDVYGSMQRWQDAIHMSKHEPTVVEEEYYKEQGIDPKFLKTPMAELEEAAAKTVAAKKKPVTRTQSSARCRNIRRCNTRSRTSIPSRV